MGLYRQYWVPQGFPATDGAYVRYPAQELAAIVCLESHRSQTVIVGENLGTVPQTVHRLMDRRGLRPMYVAEFAATGDPALALEAPEPAALASLNTHDTPTFAGWVRERDLDDQVDLGLIDADQEEVERAARRQTVAAIDAWVSSSGLAPASGGTAVAQQRVAAVLAWLAQTGAWAVLVNLEDLLLEESPQNVPGTHRERPNWRRKASATLEAMIANPWIAGVLRAVNASRSRPR
jgi:4-alpha-glucanotransferase